MQAWWSADLVNVNLAFHTFPISSRGFLGSVFILVMCCRAYVGGFQIPTRCISPLELVMSIPRYFLNRLKTPLNVLILYFLAKVRPQDSFSSQIILAT